MTTATQELFAEIIDYAGLFPPARLPVDEAFRRYLAHRIENRGWMIARFVCPAARLGELAPLVARTEPAGLPVRIAALGAGGDDPPSFAAALEHDVDAMKRCTERFGEAVRIDVFEVKLPTDGDPAETVDATFHQLTELEPSPEPFFESPLVGAAPSTRAAASAIAAASHEIDPGRRAGLKIRCGGLDAAAVPSVEAVAAAVIAARDSGLPLKATQGLHHPIRHHDPVLGTTVHGFVNLTAAVLIGGAHRLGDATIREIVAEEDGDAFALSDTSFGWRGFECTTDEIVARRQSAFTGFGSCSFTEPGDDLARLGWIGQQAVAPSHGQGDDDTTTPGN